MNSPTTTARPITTALLLTEWTARAIALGRDALAAAMSLRRAVHARGRLTVTVKRSALGDVYAGLLQLERAGLVRVERRARTAAVTVLPQR